MTHSGGKPHAVGDQGQRFEVTYLSLDDGARKVFGWSNTREGARRMQKSIWLHPAMSEPYMKDREAEHNQKKPL